jgi:hypothetical protein
MSVLTDLRRKQRSVMEFLTPEGCAPIEIHRRMIAVYGDGCMDETRKTKGNPWNIVIQILRV